MFVPKVMEGACFLRKAQLTCSVSRAGLRMGRGAGVPGRNTGQCYQKELNRSRAARATGVSITGRQDQSKGEKKSPLNDW